MPNRRVALVHPNTGGSYRSHNLRRENLGLGILSASLKRAGFAVEIFDARIADLSADKVAADVLAFEPRLVGVSLISQEAANWTTPLADAIKRNEPDTHLCLGNYFASLQPAKAMSLVKADSVTLGEGELTAVELADRLAADRDWRETQGIAYAAGNGIVAIPRPLIEDLDALPLADRYAPPHTLSEISIEGSRGCLSRCAFCAVGPHFGPGRSRWRPKSADAILGEMRATLMRYPDIRLYRFVDPDFIGSPAHSVRVDQLASGIISLHAQIQFFIEARAQDILGLPHATWIKLRDAGLVQVYFGVETGSDDIKRLLRKGGSAEQDIAAARLLSSLGIKVQYGFMMITPWATEAQIDENVRVIRQLGFCGLDKFFQELNLVPGTDALEAVRQVSAVWPDGDTGYYSYPLPAALENLRQVGRLLLACEHVAFLERVWFLYKGIQRHGLLGIAQADVLKQELSDLNAKVFAAFFEALRKSRSLLPEAVLRELITTTLSTYEAQVAALEGKLDARARYTATHDVIE